MKNHNKIIRIGIDGNEANRENRVGVNAYAYEVMKGLHRMQSEDTLVHYTIFLREEPRTHMPKENAFWKYHVLAGGSLWIVRTLTPYLIRHRHDFNVFWSPNHYTPPVPIVPLVCSVMDVGYLESSGQFAKKDYWQLKLWTAWSLIVSKRILVISESTRKDVKKHYQFVSEKLKTTLLGYDSSLFNTSIKQEQITQVKKKYGLEEYILFMSTLKPSKNIECLLHGWSLVFHEFPKTKLVIAGKKGWLFESIFETVKKLSLTESVIFTDFVLEEDKPGLIAGAKIFVLPSYWEGFGIDVVSAMACGVPVIVSDRGSLPEVVGDAGIIINPDSANTIAEAMKKVLSASQKDYNQMVKDGIFRARQFNWDETARKTQEILISTIR